MKIKIGILGIGHLGKIHYQCLQQTDFEIAGIYDPDAAKVESFVAEHNVRIFDGVDDLIDHVDVVDIVSTTTTHYELAKRAISVGKHLFIEKPVTSTANQAEELRQMAQKHKVFIQVGHVERYNPALRSIHEVDFNPKFIEGHRLATFNPRSNDISVILDLMIHDLDLVLYLVKSPIIDIQANGVAVINDTPDICNTRLTFENGCVANLTASRISMKQMRKLRLFQENEYISLDFLRKESQVIRLENCDDNSMEGMIINTSGGKKKIIMETPKAEESNAIVEELKAFYQSIVSGTAPEVGIIEGLNAVKLAERIAMIVDKKRR